MKRRLLSQIALSVMLLGIPSTGNTFEHGDVVRYEEKALFCYDRELETALQLVFDVNKYYVAPDSDRTEEDQEVIKGFIDTVIDDNRCVAIRGFEFVSSATIFDPAEFYRFVFEFATSLVKAQVHLKSGSIASGYLLINGNAPPRRPGVVRRSEGSPGPTAQDALKEFDRMIKEIQKDNE